MEPEKLEECLVYLGCDEKERSDIMERYHRQDIRGMIRLLRLHRQSALEAIHNEEKQLGCLDHLVFMLEQEMDKEDK